MFCKTYKKKGNPFEFPIRLFDVKTFEANSPSLPSSGGVPEGQGG